jgi:hypothetical protein
MPLMTQKAYAARVGVTPQYIGKLVAERKIVKVGKLIDSKQADQARKAWARAGRVLPAKRSVKRESRPKGACKPAASETVVHQPRNSATRSLTEARAQREHFGALTAELEYKRASGSLLPRDQVLEAERRKNTNIRTSFRRLARSLAPLLARAGSPAEAETILLSEIDLVLAQLARDPLGAHETAHEAVAPNPEPIAPPAYVIQAGDAAVSAEAAS